MTWRNVRKRGWVFPLFSPDSDDRLSLNFLGFVILYISCDTRSVGLWTILFTDVVRLKINSLELIFAATSGEEYTWGAPASCD